MARVSPGLSRHRSRAWPGAPHSNHRLVGEKNHPPHYRRVTGGHISLRSSPPGSLAAGDSPGRCLHRAPISGCSGLSRHLLALETNRAPAKVAPLSSSLPLLPPPQPGLVAALPCTCWLPGAPAPPGERPCVSPQLSPTPQRSSVLPSLGAPSSSSLLGSSQLPGSACGTPHWTGSL